MVLKNLLNFSDTITSIAKSEALKLTSYITESYLEKRAQEYISFNPFERPEGNWESLKQLKGNLNFVNKIVNGAIYDKTLQLLANYGALTLSRKGYYFLYLPEENKILSLKSLDNKLFYYFLTQKELSRFGEIWYPLEYPKAKIGSYIRNI